MRRAVLALPPSSVQHASTQTRQAGVVLPVMPTGHGPSTLGGAHNACRIPFGHPGSVLG